MFSSSVLKRPRDESDDEDAPGLHTGARKKMTRSHPLTHAGRHFGRAVYAFTDLRHLITQGIKRASKLENLDAQDRAAEMELWTARARREYAVYNNLLDICGGLENMLTMSASAEEIQTIADLIQKGCAGARADDTKGMKGAVIDWLTPPGGSLDPPLNRRHKTTRGFNHEATGKLLCPAGLDWANPEIKKKLGSGEHIVAGHHWPIFIYADNTYDPDDPWNGLLRSELLIKAFKHVFISPSAADSNDDTTPTKSGNAKIHGMHKVTKASIVYVATQVRFALSSAAHWSRSDKVTDSENFYTSLLETLEDPVHGARVDDLLLFWDKKIFPHQIPEATLIPVEGSALDRIRQTAIRDQQLACHGV